MALFTLYCKFFTKEINKYLLMANKINIYIKLFWGYF